MAIEYLGLSQINGSLIAIEGMKDAAYDEVVEIVVDGKQKKLGRIVACYSSTFKAGTLFLFTLGVRDLRIN